MILLKKGKDWRNTVNPGFMYLQTSVLNLSFVCMCCCCFFCLFLFKFTFLFYPSITLSGLETYFYNFELSNSVMVYTVSLARIYEVLVTFLVAIHQFYDSQAFVSERASSFSITFLWASLSYDISHQRITYLKPFSTLIVSWISLIYSFFIHPFNISFCISVWRCSCHQQDFIDTAHLCWEDLVS